MNIVGLKERMMKKTGVLLAVTITLNGFSQHHVTEHKEMTENGVTKGWTITKELDTQGNVIDYDSTYYEKEAGDFNRNDWNQMDSPFNDDAFGSPFSNQEFGSFGNDSSRFEPFQFNDSLMNHFSDAKWEAFEKLMQEHQQQMEEFMKRFEQMSPEFNNAPIEAQPPEQGTRI